MEIAGGSEQTLARELELGKLSNDFSRAETPMRKAK